MLHHFRSSPRSQFLSLALFTAMLSLCTGLLAIITARTDPLNAQFQMKLGDEFGISIKTKQYEKDAVIQPGGTAPFDPYLINSGDSDAYVFMEVIFPEESFSIDNKSMSDKWELVSLQDDVAVYSYSSKGSLTPLPKENIRNNTNTSVTPALCQNIALSDDTMLMDDTYTVTATGYAIQTKGLDSADPTKVWKMIKDN